MNYKCCSSSKRKTVYKKVTHVIFNLDDTEAIYRDILTEIAAEYGKTFTSEMHFKMQGRIDKDGAEVVVAELNLPITIAKFLYEFRQRSKNLLHTCQFMPGAEKLIRHFSKNHIPIAVATSSNQDGVDIKIAKFKATVFSLFHHIVVGGSDPQVERGKPDPDIYLICASRFPDNPKPDQCLVFEDAPLGVAAAIAAGMQCIMVPDPEINQKLTKQATEVLSSLEDVKPEKYGLPEI